ncbi:MAG: thiosulfate oxidation carrier complex protein SoxZ [Reyranella sp.]|uniref:thiosulfate oxidation carrier complex protein SoxZ n=1 Tax=Reyranella sp. TaxID=1929291 RepID=UPI003D12394A
MANVMINVPKTARRGEVIEIKALILHPMETGFRPGTNGRIIPRNIIERFTATWNGREVFSMAMSPAVAANPFVSFFAVASESGTIALRWTGDEGFAVEEQVAITVG